MPDTIPGPLLSADGRTWTFADGTVLPVVAGGQDGGEGGAGGQPAGEGAGGQPGGGGGDATGEGGDQAGSPAAGGGPAAEGSDADPAEALGDAGKKALQAERDARKAAEKKAKSAEAELAKLREAQMSEHEKAVEAARREGATETETRFQRRLFAAEAKVAAAGKLADPTLLADPDVAKNLLGLDDIPMDGENIDSEAISKAIDQLVEKRPFLKAAGQGDATWPSNGSEAGPRGDGAKSQLSRGDLKNMSPEEISKARAEGRLANLLAGKT